ncbi:MAG: S8 family serine peptidase, partial [Anaerolineales bacterium]|nr:S8 family serine peptidase [Anaerolineales bacterium]
MPFDLNDLYYYVEDERVSLELSLDWIAVRSTAQEFGQAAQVLEGIEALAAVSGEVLQIPHPRITLVSLHAEGSPSGLAETVNTIRAYANGISLANPVFVHPDALMVVTDEFIATFPSSMSSQQIQSVNSANHVEQVEPLLDQPNTFVLRVLPAARLDALSMANYYQEELGISAAPNFLRLLSLPPSSQTARQDMQALAVYPNDPYFYDQWSLYNFAQYGTGMVADADVDAPEAWDIQIGNSKVIIAIVDEGVDFSHEDLKNNMVAGYDATGQGSKGRQQGDDAHGTNVAGLAAAVTNNNRGVAGICQRCSLMPIRIAYGYGSGWVTTDSWIANGIAWAYTKGAWIINNSWGGGSPSTAINTAISNAKSLGRKGLGSVVIFSAGNDNFSTVSYPASLSSVIAVGASNMCDQRKTPTSNLCNGFESWWGSNYGSALDISAPGVWLDSTDITGSKGYSAGSYFIEMNGTSGAAPIVSGVAGLMLSANPNLTAAQVQSILESTADDINTAGWDTQTGWGRVNAYKAVFAVSPPKAPILTGLAAGAMTNSASVTLSWQAVSGAVTYQIQIDNDSKFNSPEHYYSVAALSSVRSIPVEGKYFWRVRAVNAYGVAGIWSSVRSFTVDRTAPSMPLLTKPANFVVIRGVPVVSWKKPSGSPVAYEVQYSATANFSSGVQTFSNVKTLNFKASNFAPVGVRYVRVRAADAVGNWSGWSTAHTITILPLKPIKPVTVLPGNKANTNDTTPTLTWNAVPYGNTYQVQIATRPNFAPSFMVQDSIRGVGVLNYTATTLAEGAYHWRVRAINVNGEFGAWSAVRSFAVDTTAPAIPVI